MKTKDFYQFYDLSEMDVLSISNKEGDVAILFNADVQMELMANGFRGGFDLSFCQEAIFQGVQIKKEFLSPLHITSYTYLDDHLEIIIDDDLIIIPETEVTIHKIKTNRV